MGRTVLPPPRRSFVSLELDRGCGQNLPVARVNGRLQCVVRNSNYHDIRRKVDASSAAATGTARFVTRSLHVRRLGAQRPATRWGPVLGRGNGRYRGKRLPATMGSAAQPGEEGVASGGWRVG